MDNLNLKASLVETWKSSLPLLALVSFLTSFTTTILIGLKEDIAERQFPVEGLLLALPWLLALVAYIVSKNRYLTSFFVVIGSIAGLLVRNDALDWRDASIISLELLTLAAILLSKDIEDRNSPVVRIGVTVAVLWTVIGGVLVFVFETASNTLSWYPRPDLSVQVSWLLIAGVIAGIVMLYLNPRLAFALAIVTGLPIMLGQLATVFDGYPLPVWALIQTVIGSSLDSVAIATAAVLLLGRSVPAPETVDAE